MSAAKTSISRRHLFTQLFGDAKDLVVRSQISAVRRRAVVDKGNCLAYQGGLCSSCYYACGDHKKAISLLNNKLPVVNEDLCDGCGQCASVCLADYGIRVQPQ